MRAAIHAEVGEDPVAYASICMKRIAKSNRHLTRTNYAASVFRSNIEEERLLGSSACELRSIIEMMSLIGFDIDDSAEAQKSAAEKTGKGARS